MFSFQAASLKSLLDDIRTKATDLTVSCSSASFEETRAALVSSMERYSRSKEAERLVGSVLELREAVQILIAKSVEVDQQLRDLNDLSTPLRVVLRLCQQTADGGRSGSSQGPSASTATMVETAKEFISTYRKFTLFLRELGSGSRTNRGYVIQVKALLANLSDLDEAEIASRTGKGEIVDKLKEVTKGAVLLSKEYVASQYDRVYLNRLTDEIDKRIVRLIDQITTSAEPTKSKSNKGGAAKWGQVNQKVERVPVMGAEGATWEQLNQGGLIANHEGNRPIDGGATIHNRSYQTTQIPAEKMTERDHELEDIEAMMEFA